MSCLPELTLEHAELLLRIISCRSCYRVCYSVNVVAVELSLPVTASVYVLPTFIRVFNPETSSVENFDLYKKKKKTAKSDNCSGHFTDPHRTYRLADNSRPLSFTVSAWEWVYATNLSRLQRDTSKRHVGEAHSVLITAILLPQRLSCYGGKTVSLCMITNLRLADLRLTTAQQRTTGQDLPSDLY
jgi:hypothetical protein